MTERSNQPTIDAAHALVISMRAAIAKLQPNGTVRMSGDQFTQMARLIDNLSNLPTPLDQESFDAPLDGIRWWIPLPEHQRVLSQLDAARLRMASAHQDAGTAAAYPDFHLSR